MTESSECGLNSATCGCSTSRASSLVSPRNIVSGAATEFRDEFCPLALGLKCRRKETAESVRECEHPQVTVANLGHQGTAREFSGECWKAV